MEALVNALLGMLTILGIIVTAILIFAVVFVFVFALITFFQWLRRDDETGG